MNITKEQADKVIAALEVAYKQNGCDMVLTGEELRNRIIPALSIMRGLAEDAEPVASGGHKRYSCKTEFDQTVIGGDPRPIATSPQAAQTEAQEREEFEAEFDQLCKDYSIYGTMEARLCKVFFEAGRAGRKV